MKLILATTVQAALAAPAANAAAQSGKIETDQSDLSYYRSAALAAHAATQSGKIETDHAAPLKQLAEDNESPTMGSRIANLLTSPLRWVGLDKASFACVGDDGVRCSPNLALQASPASAKQDSDEEEKRSESGGSRRTGELIVSAEGDVEENLIFHD